MQVPAAADLGAGSELVHVAAGGPVGLGPQGAERLPVGEQGRRVGVELAKRLLWSGLDAASLEAHMRHEGVAQLYVRNLTGNFEEMIRARKDGRTPEYRDDARQKNG